MEVFLQVTGMCSLMLWWCDSWFISEKCTKIFKIDTQILHDPSLPLQILLRFNFAQLENLLLKKKEYGQSESKQTSS